ncbi:hypothetical protein T492DRAFT_836734 [Pavlovales sp. CCMP2436]|nr:hypothetical protein T492DRAFT_836734 [Pavlovales sp. CCMP2436]
MHIILNKLPSLLLGSKINKISPENFRCKLYTLVLGAFRGGGGCAIYILIKKSIYILINQPTLFSEQARFEAEAAAREAAAAAADEAEAATAVGSIAALREAAVSQAGAICAKLWLVAPGAEADEALTLGALTASSVGAALADDLRVHIA